MRVTPRAWSGQKIEKAVMTRCTLPLKSLNIRLASWEFFGLPNTWFLTTTTVSPPKTKLPFSFWGLRTSKVASTFVSATAHKFSSRVRFSLNDSEELDGKGVHSNPALSRISRRRGEREARINFNFFGLSFFECIRSRSLQKRSGIVMVLPDFILILGVLLGGVATYV